MFTFSETKKDGIQTITLTGQFGVEAVHAHEYEILRLITPKNKKVILDLSGLEFLGSSGFRILYVIAKIVKLMDGKMLVCGTPARIKGHLGQSDYANMFAEFETVQDAMAHIN
jgi:anti-anti-sigma factor